ncbi:hypothetical protein G7Y89_g2064 [Cudoniella acicularis]|uniref:Uncharacterized protein n=1 Tax=Cudoniella acicularis TaxID=354080 RepID=A0A8H4W6U3_9HELO|nr:hypothetical protein G7Y89_g2064 [Cudoniella acicularis]
MDDDGQKDAKAWGSTSRFHDGLSLTYRRLKAEEQKWHLNGLDNESIVHQSVSAVAPRRAFKNGTGDKTQTYERQNVSGDARLVGTMHSTSGKRRSRYRRTWGSRVEFGPGGSDSARRTGW